MKKERWDLHVLKQNKTRVIVSKYCVAQSLWKKKVGVYPAPPPSPPSGCHLLKKLINLHEGLLDVTTNIYLKSCAHHPASECRTFFHGNLSNPKSSKDTLICLYVFETCWSRLIYTKVSSHRSFVINMYVVTMAWRCISPWSFHRSPQRRREMDIFGNISRFPRILSKTNQKKKKRKPQLNAQKPW